MKLCGIAPRNAGSWNRESFGSCHHQRSENPCHVLRDRPALKEKMIAMITGRIDQAMYAHVNVARNTGLRHGLRSQPRGAFAVVTGTATGAAIVVSLIAASCARFVTAQVVPHRDQQDPIRRSTSTPARGPCPAWFTAASIRLPYIRVFGPPIRSFV